MQKNATCLNRHTLQELLKSCAINRNNVEGQRVHSLVLKEGFNADPVVGTALVGMYAKWGFMEDAAQEFDNLRERDVVAWTALIAGYAQQGACIQTLKCLEQMRLENTSPNVITYLCMLKGSGNAGALECGQKIHIEIVNQGFENDLSIGSVLIYFYGKCGFVSEAEAVFQRLSDRNEYAWNALIAAYSGKKSGQEVLELFNQMQLEGLSPDLVTFISGLKGCGITRNAEKGQCIHIDIVKQGLDTAAPVGNSLLDMYAKCGFLVEAENVFNRLSGKNMVSWTSLLIGYADYGINERGLFCLHEMQGTGLGQDAMTFVASLKVIASSNDQRRDYDVHLQIVVDGYDTNVYVSNSLIDFYAQSGLFPEAVDILKGLPSRDIISWNALIAGFVEHEAAEEALLCVQQMQQDCVTSDAVTLICSVRACSFTGDAVRGQELHADITRKGYDLDLYVGNTVIDMFAKCGLLMEASHTFATLPIHDVASWTARISGLSDHGFGMDALQAFEDMLLEGVFPNMATYICCLKASGSIRAISRGQVLHARITKEGLDCSSPLGSTAVDMYAKCGFLLDAQAVFQGLSLKDDQSYNALLWGYAEYGYGVEAFKCMEDMIKEGLIPDSITFCSILKACISFEALDFGQDIHCDIVKRGFDKDPFVGDLLVDFYAKLGLHIEAYSSCNGVAMLKVVPWNMLICGYVEHGDGEEALNCLKQMQRRGLFPDEVTYVSCLKACGIIGSSDSGRNLHSGICEEGLEVDLFISNTLVNMYAKCGLLVEARELFDDLPYIDSVSWNVLITGYASHGDMEQVLDLLKRMRQDSIAANSITIFSILTVSNHSGLVNECQEYFQVLNREHAALLVLDNYNGMVDMLGRACQHENAKQMLEFMPFHPNLVTWSSVLSSCTKLGLVGLGKWAFNIALSVNQREPSMFVSMANLYVDSPYLTLSGFNGSSLSQNCRADWTT